MTLTKNTAVTITNIAGITEHAEEDPKYQIIGATGYVLDEPKDGWVSVLIPTHLYYSKGKGAYLKVDEVELV